MFLASVCSAALLKQKTEAGVGYTCRVKRHGRVFFLFFLLFVVIVVVACCLLGSVRVLGFVDRVRWFFFEIVLSGEMMTRSVTTKKNEMVSTITTNRGEKRQKMKSIILMKALS